MSGSARNPAGGRPAGSEDGRSVPTIGVNLTWLVPGVVGGSEEYIVRLLEAVAPMTEGRYRLQLYARPELAAAHPGLAERYRLVTAPLGGMPAGSKPARVALEHSWLPVVSRHDHFIHHPGGTVPSVRAQPAIVTVHDLQPLEMPEHFHPVKRVWLGRGLPYAARVSRLVLCPSGFTADRLRDLLAVPEAKIRVVPHGHRPPDTGPRLAGPSTDRDDVSARFGRYLLYPTIAYPHKRHVDLVRALPRLDDRFRDVAVVFTGRPGPELEAVLAEAAGLGVAHRVHSLGRVPSAELERLYRSAAAMVFPSSYEGFGNPVLEAMGLGCPVVVSDAGALPEVVGDAGLIFPTGDVAALADAVVKLLDNPALTQTMGRLGRERARVFDPGIAARRLADVYGELVDSVQH